MHTSAIHEKATEGNFRSNCRRYALSEYSVLYFKIVRPFPLQMAHFYTGVCVPVCVLYEANSPDICMSGFLHHFVPYKGLHPLRRYAAIPAYFAIGAIC